jgi:signal transduction histidine kinase
MAALPERAGDDRFKGEQAALRRVATLVARGAAPEDVFSAVTAEAGRLLHTDFATINRYDSDGAVRVVASWSSTGAASPIPSRWMLGGRNIHTMVFQTGRPARIDDQDAVPGPIGDAVRELGLRAAVGVSVSVAGGLWGLVVVASRAGPLPTGTEAQLVGFTELAATAVANAQARVELRGYAEEQAALRRVATLVASAAAPEEVFASITQEAGRVLHTDSATMGRYDPDGAARVVASWSTTGRGYPAGARAEIGAHDLHTMVLRTGRPARIDDYNDASGSIAELARQRGLRAGVGVPVSVEGRLWGLTVVESHAEPLPPGTESRLAGFTELAATAIANAQARVELGGFAEEQAALRRVATLVARAASSAEVLTAVTEETGRLLHADHAMTGRYSPDGSTTVVAAWDSTGAATPVGAEAELGGQDLHTMVFQSGRPARVDDHSGGSGKIGDAVRKLGIRAAVGVPVSVEGQLWGLVIVASRTGPLPPCTESRLAGFTELAATAIANAEAQAALTVSRARIVATADATRRRIERNLHDGAQQRLVSLTLDLRAAQAAAQSGAGVAQQLDRLAAGMDGVLDDLREIASGLHPAILAESGLAPALKTLCRRAAVPVDLDIQVGRRLPEPVETAAYYSVAEALTNVAKHAQAAAAEIEVAERDEVLHVRVRDDGCGGAGFGRGSGLLGLKDRAEALGGRLRLSSPRGCGTTLNITLPLRGPGGIVLPSGAAGPADDAGVGR